MSCISLDPSQLPKILNFLFIFDFRLFLWPTIGEMPKKEKKKNKCFLLSVILMQGAGVFKISGLTSVSG